jgi:hypothetical protein
MTLAGINVNTVIPIDREPPGPPVPVRTILQDLAIGSKNGKHGTAGLRL